jgi:translation initiation factor 2 beta subunit (eIF-2beta)/eIF-5
MDMDQQDSISPPVNVNSDNVDVEQSKQFYDMNYLLDRAYGSISTKNNKIMIVRPDVSLKNRKTFFNNFRAVCASIGYTSDADENKIKKYLEKELQTTSSIKQDGRLKIDTIIRSTGSIEKHMSVYITHYIMCDACKSINTERQKISRVNFLVCKTCNSKRALAKEI